MRSIVSTRNTDSFVRAKPRQPCADMAVRAPFPIHSGRHFGSRPPSILDSPTSTDKLSHSVKTAASRRYSPDSESERYRLGQPTKICAGCENIYGVGQWFNHAQLS